MERSVLAGIAVFRWLAWVQMATVLAFDRHHLARPWVAWGLVVAALAVTTGATLWLRRSPPEPSAPSTGLVLGELFCGCALFIGGGIAYSSAGFATAQSLGVAWPLAGVFVAASTAGVLTGLGAGLLVGSSRFAASLANGIPARHLVDTGHLVGTLTPVLLFAMAGATVGYLVTLMRDAESAVAAARAREEVARTLHDGVLQTLAVVERRVDDPDLVRMARDQERELRAFLEGQGPPLRLGLSALQVVSHKGADTPDLAAALRAAGARFERSFGGRVEVVVLDGVPRLAPPVLDALVGAAGEAMTNAGKHGRASRVTVFVEREESGERGRASRGAATVFCSVKDDGVGFDPGAVAEGIGLSRSVRGRMEEVGGRVEISSRVGSGTEVRLWV